MLKAKLRGRKWVTLRLEPKLVYSVSAKVDDFPSEANRRRTISILVSRHIANVKRMIVKAGGDIFLKF